jgi:tetratricopeptide (TPR) repeat protein
MTSTPRVLLGLPQGARTSGAGRWPALPPQDPLAALVAGEVPPSRRFCSSCEEPLRAEQGRCRCGQEFSFVPTLRPGDVLSGRYEIKGTLAFGGLGWIYLALDLILGRWVTLKGLLNAHDPRLLDVAVQEREYLAAVKHPNIVSIHDFLTHARQGFIVMEFVNGRSLTRIRKDAGGPLPVGDALAYLQEALLALAYLHRAGLVFCDFKPDNVMIEEDTLKLIDLGAVRRIDEVGGDIYGSRGYCAPEAAERPSPSSDLYSVGRTLAVLVASFDYQGKHEHDLPPPEECEVFRRHPALFALLRKATAADPARRFSSADELREQLAGVLCMEAPDTGRRPPESHHVALGEGWVQGDPVGDTSLPPLHPGDEEAATWRRWWREGAEELARGQGGAALERFRQVAEELPGELGPLLALGRAHEALGQDAEASAVYERALRAASLPEAAFGASRCWLRLGQRRKAIDVLRSVAPAARHHARACLRRVELLLLGEPEADDALEAAEILEKLGVRGDPLEVAILRADTLTAAARRAARGEVRGGKVLGVSFDSSTLRRAAEEAYRASASLTEEPFLRAHLLDEAAALRPWTLF